ncbi:MAG TPA: NACHT domain-containing protein [Pyrinomonadaceae bacterium]|jgi:hypothetical protein
MAERIIKRLPDVKTLYDILPKGTEGGKEFARIVDLLLFHEARREGKRISIFSDVAGDYYGLDSFMGNSFRKEGTTGYQYKFYPSPLSVGHRKEIVESLNKVSSNQKQLKLKKWILVTPQDLTESATRKDKGDVSWFEGLRTQLKLKFEIEHWGHRSLQSLFLQTPYLCLFYYPELTSNSDARRTIEDTRKRYNDNLETLYRNIEFVGMSVYKQEATRGVPMEHIYIPLTVVPEAADEADNNITRINPLKFLEPTAKRVILGDPGSGKSTLLRFLALVGTSRPLQRRSDAKPDKRLPILITLRRYADELKSRHNLALIDYIQESIQGDFNLKSADLTFFEYYLETGQAILLFDGLDELPSSNFKQIVRDRIRTLVTTYPGNTVLVSSRIVGYESNLRFDDKEFGHYQLTRLQLSEMERFVKDWYQARIENTQEREANAEDLIRILRNEDHAAIRELAENPLLLTIVALVHRIDAVLPDERVVLYLKCTETLLNTWHTWKYRDAEVKNRGREERRNRRRMEAIANWMHKQSLGTGKDQRSVVSYKDLHAFLSKYISDAEKPYDPDNDPEDIASDFLEFVKKKAGLLIEVGDEQYSFVHQTFQEYLTAAYIINSNETNGINGIWNDIKEYCNDPRWLEVIRLLVAALQSNESQRILLEKILNEIASTTQITKSQLLGGLLLDGIEPAEIRTQEIIKQLLQSASITTNDSSQLRPLLSMLRTWSIKDNVNEEKINQVFHSTWEDTKTNRQKLTLKLTSTALNWSGNAITDANKTDFVEIKDRKLLNLFFDDPENIDFDTLKTEFRTLWNFQDLLSLTSSFGNLVSTSFQALTACLPANIAAKRFFEEQLIVLSTNPSYGPFGHYNFHSFTIACDNDSCKDGVIAKIDFNSPRNFIEKPRRLKVLTTAVEDAVQFSRRKPLLLAEARLKSLNRSDLDDYLEFRLTSKSVQKKSRIRMSIPYSNGSVWSNILGSPSHYSYILDVICTIFNLKPTPHWWEALRIHFLPIVPKRIKLFKEVEYKKLEKEIFEGNIVETNIYKAAWFLLFDSWLYTNGIYDSSEQSRFKQLAALTKSNDAPPLRIAHCIRDLSFGDTSRAVDLVDMANSSDSEYREIFETCLWRNDDSAKPKLRKVTSSSERRTK